MNHRFLGKCGRGFAHSPASMWGLPITRSSDLNVTYITAFFLCGGRLVEHHTTTQKQKNLKPAQTCEGACCHTIATLRLWNKCLHVSESLAWFAHRFIHKWKWNIKCHVFQWFNLKCNHVVFSTSMSVTPGRGLQTEIKHLWLYIWITF